MATPLIAAIRQRRDLKESLTHTAQELAHLASIYGVVRVSYSYLAEKCHCSRRTVIRHIQRLIDLRHSPQNGPLDSRQLLRDQHLYLPHCLGHTGAQGG